MNGFINFCLVLGEKKEQGFAKIFSCYDNTDVPSLLLKAIIIFFRQHCTFKLLECNHTHTIGFYICKDFETRQRIIV